MLFGFFKKKEKAVPKFKCSKCGAENPMDAKFCLSCGAGLGEQKAVQGKVAEATEITEDFKDKGGFWAKIIPGYHGYKKKEIRRESDRLLRDHLVKQMTNTKNELDAIAEEAASSKPDLVMKIEDMRTELDTFLRKIQHADYGYAGLFGSDKIKENELDKLIEFDRSIVEVVMELQNDMKKLTADTTEAGIKDLRSKIKQSIQYYGQRDEFIRGWTPS